MGQVEVLTFRVVVDPTNSKAELQGLTTQLEATGKVGTKSLAGLSTSAVELAGSLGLVVSTGAALSLLRTSFLDFAATERQWNAVAFQMRAVGDATGSQAKRSRELINVLSDQTGLLDNDLIPAYQRLFLGTRDVAFSQDLLAVAARFAANGIGDVRTNADKLADSIQSGTVRALKDFGVQTEDAAGNAISLGDGLGQVFDRFKELNPELDDAQSKVDSLRQKWEKLKSTLASQANEMFNQDARDLQRVLTFLTGGAMVGSYFGAGDVKLAEAGDEAAVFRLKQKADAAQAVRDKAAAAERAAADAIKAAVEAERRRLELLQQSVALSKIYADLNLRIAASTPSQFNTVTPSGLISKLAAGDLANLPDTSQGTGDLDNFHATIEAIDRLGINYQTATDRSNELTRAQNLLDEAFRAGFINLEQYKAGLSSASAQFQDFSAITVAGTDILVQAANTIGPAIAGALANSDEPFKEQIGQVLLGLGTQMIGQGIVQLVYAAIASTGYGEIITGATPAQHVKTAGVAFAAGAALYGLGAGLGASGGTSSSGGGRGGSTSSSSSKNSGTEYAGHRSFGVEIPGARGDTYNFNTIDGPSTKSFIRGSEYRKQTRLQKRRSSFSGRS